MFRQGDVVLTPLKAVPAGAVPVDPVNGRLILAYGEVTGHHHSFKFHDMIRMFREDGVGGGLIIQHMGARIPACDEACKAVYDAKRAYDQSPSPEAWAEVEMKTAGAVALGAQALEHQEHWAIPIAPGSIMRGSVQREYHPEAIRNVAD